MSGRWTGKGRGRELRTWVVAFKHKVCLHKVLGPVLQKVSGNFREIKFDGVRCAIGPLSLSLRVRHESVRLRNVKMHQGVCLYAGNRRGHVSSGTSPLGAL